MIPPPTTITRMRTSPPRTSRAKAHLSGGASAGTPSPMQRDDSSAPPGGAGPRQLRLGCARAGSVARGLQRRALLGGVAFGARLLLLLLLQAELVLERPD